MAGIGRCSGNIVLIWWAWLWTIVFGGNFLLEDKLIIEGEKKEEMKKEEEKETERKKLKWICVLWENAIGNNFTKHLENKNRFHPSNMPLV